MAIRMIQKAACMNQSLPINSNQTGRKFINKQATSIATTTQMALKNVALVAALLMAAAVAPPAASQLLNDNVIITGRVPCSSVAINITQTTPVFPNATVLLRCGQDNVTITVSNRNGAFSLLIAANITTNLSALLGSCRIVVRTPLFVCNPLLQSNGTLQAPLQLHSSNLSLGGILGAVTNLVPSIFQLVP